MLTIENSDTAPEGGAGASYAQLLSHEINTIRDRAIVVRIGAALDRYGEVIVVYGGSHLMTQEPALRGALGAAPYEKLF